MSGKLPSTRLSTDAPRAMPVFDAGMRSIPSASTSGSIGDPAPSWIHEAPRSTAAPATSIVCVRPPIRSRPSTTTTSIPASCSARAATSPAIPAPTTMTRWIGPSTGVGMSPPGSSTCTIAVAASLLMPVILPLRQRSPVERRTSMTRRCGAEIRHDATAVLIERVADARTAAPAAGEARSRHRSRRSVILRRPVARPSGR